IDDLVPGPGQVRLERLLELEASVVSAQVDLHGGSSAVVCECQSKIGPVVRVRLSSKKPGTLAAATTPSYRRPASSPLGAGEMTGPKNATSPTATTGVPTSSPTFEIPSWCEARSCSSYRSESAASRREAGRPTSSRASATAAMWSSAPPGWMRVPIAV